MRKAHTDHLQNPTSVQLTQGRKKKPLNLPLHDLQTRICVIVGLHTLFVFDWHAWVPANAVSQCRQRERVVRYFRMCICALGCMPWV